LHCINFVSKSIKSERVVLEPSFSIRRPHLQSNSTPEPSLLPKTRQSILVGATLIRHSLHLQTVISIRITLNSKVRTRKFGSGTMMYGSKIRTPSTVPLSAMKTLAQRSANSTMVILFAWVTTLQAGTRLWRRCISVCLPWV